MIDSTKRNPKMREALPNSMIKLYSSSQSDNAHEGGISSLSYKT